MVLAVSPNPKAPCFDCRETESDGLPKRGSVNVRNTVLITDLTIRKVEPLPGDVSVRVRSVVGGEPTVQPRHKRALRVRPYALRSV